MPSTATFTTAWRREERGGLNGEGKKAAGAKKGEETITTWKRKRERTQVIKLMINYSSSVEFLMSSGHLELLALKHFLSPKVTTF